jgi:hypothetical protein
MSFFISSQKPYPYLERPIAQMKSSITSKSVLG